MYHEVLRRSPRIAARRADSHRPLWMTSSFGFWILCSPPPPADTATSIAASSRLRLCLFLGQPDHAPSRHPTRRQPSTKCSEPLWPERLTGSVPSSTRTANAATVVAHVALNRRGSFRFIRLLR